jgi:hypothetical protein
MLQNHSLLLGVGIGLFCALAILTVHYVAGVLAGWRRRNDDGRPIPLECRQLRSDGGNGWKWTGQKSVQPDGSCLARFGWRARLVGRREGEGEMTGPRPAGRPWTRAEDHLLKEMLKAGLKAPEIAQKLKRTIGAVHARKIALKARPKAW